MVENSNMKSNVPFITISMPVRNEELFIKDTLDELINQNYPNDRYEIIVADGESTDSTCDIVKAISKDNPQVILMNNPGRLPSSGRNVGFKNGRGDLFVVIDGHCSIKNENLLRNIADCFERSGAQCLGRPQPFLIPEKATMQRAIALARTSKFGHSSDSFIHSDEEGYFSPVSMGCAYKREVFEKIGFVDEAFDACEDVEFNYRVEKAGFSSFFSPKIAVHYSPRETIPALWRQLTRYSVGRIKFIHKHPETKSLGMFSPLFFVLGLFLGPFFGLISKYFLLVYFLVLFLYLTLLSLESIRLSRGYGLPFAGKLLFTFAAIHLSIGTGLLKGFVRRIQAK